MPMRIKQHRRRIHTRTHKAAAYRFLACASLYCYAVANWPTLPG